MEYIQLVGRERVQQLQEGAEQVVARGVHEEAAVREARRGAYERRVHLVEAEHMVPVHELRERLQAAQRAPHLSRAQRGSASRPPDLQRVRLVHMLVGHTVLRAARVHFHLSKSLRDDVLQLYS